ncbi:MAG TPA: hypothetical protein DDW27_21385 [Bacteroidales bacterium]|nr:hypothetical protein [Bacteroidales bacterium]
MDLKIKKWDPRILFRSLRHGFSAWLGVTEASSTQLTLNDVAFSNVKTRKITIGGVGVSDCDFNFATADNITEQPIDLGAIVPALARVLDVKTHTEVAFAHAVTGTASRAVTTNVATIKTASAHGLVTGNSVVVAGMTDATYNGTHTITRVDNTTFTYSLTHANESETPDTAGTVTFSALALAAETGNATSGNQFIASATIKALNAITAQAQTAALNNAPVATASNVWVSATPDGKWNHITTGKLAVYVTYIEVV